MASVTDININHLKETMKIAISDEIKNETQGMKLRSDKDKDDILSVTSLETVLNKVFSKFIDEIVPMLEYIKNESTENKHHKRMITKEITYILTTSKYHFIYFCLFPHLFV